MTEASLPRIRWGIVSTGHIAGVFASDLALLPDAAELAAVTSRDAGRAAAFAAEFGVARSYGSVEELAADPDVDVVYVASTNNDHFPASRACLQAGKGVLCEKAMALSVAETEELVGIARDRGVLLMEAVWMRTNPLVRRAAEIAAAGEIGTLRHVETAFGFAFDGPDDHRLLNPDLGGGSLLDLGIYPVHAVDLYLGEPDGLVGFGTRASTGVENHCMAALRWDRGPNQPAVTGSIACSLTTGLDNRLYVYGDAGRIELDFLIKPGTVKVFRGNGNDVEPEVLTTELPGGGYTFQAEEVMRCLRAGETESPMVPWAATLGAARTLERWRAVVA